MKLEVDRLTIRLTGHAATDARRLAELVGDGLAAAATRGLRDAGTVKTTVASRTGEPLEATASRIVDAMVGALPRSS